MLIVLATCIVVWKYFNNAVCFNIYCSRRISSIMTEEWQKQEDASHIASISWKQTENRKWGLGYKSSRPIPTVPLPPKNLHILKVVQPSSVVPPPGDQMFKHLSLLGILYIQTTTLIMPINHKINQITHLVLCSFIVYISRVPWAVSYSKWVDE